MKGATQTLPRNTKDLISLAKDQGWEHSRQSNGHHKLVSPDGKVVGMSGTPSDYRAVKNFRMQLKRAGLRILAKIPKEKKVEEKVSVAMGAVAPEKRKKVQNPNLRGGILRNAILEGARKRDNPSGVSGRDIMDIVQFAIGYKPDPRIVSSALTYYGSATGGNLLTRVGYGRYRLTELHKQGTGGGAALERREANKAAVAASFATHTNSAPQAAPTAAEPPSMTPDDELDQLLDTIVSALGRVQQIVGQTKEARKKLREIIGAI